MLFNIATNKNNTIYYGIITIIAAFYAIIYCTMPPYADDLWYMLPIKDYCEGVDTSFPWEGLKNGIIDHYLYDNIRSSNVVFTFSLLLPRWVSGTLAGVMMWLLLHFGAKLADIRNSELPSLTIFTAMIVLILPWQETMFAHCYSYNYLWSSSLSLILIYIFINNNLSAWFSFLFGLFVGTWHEGFAAPLLAGFLTYILLRKKQVTRQQSFISIGLLIGLLWLTAAPGSSSRMSNQLSSFTFIFPKIYSLILLFVGFATVCFFIKKYKALILNDQIIILLVASITSFALQIILHKSGMRVGWWGIFCAIIGITNIMKKAFANEMPPKLCNLVATITFLFVGTHLASACYYSFAIRDDYKTVISEYRKSENGLVFSDITLEQNTPSICLRKPDFYSLNSYGPIGKIFDWYYSDGDKQLRVVPSILKNYDEKLGKKIAGNNDFKLHEGHLVSSSSKYNTGDYIFVKLNFGYFSETIPIVCTRFKADNGNEYVYALPFKSFFSMIGMEIDSFDIL